jgi:endonuclease YncB( thermonuclease family)
VSYRRRSLFSAVVAVCMNGLLALLFSGCAADESGVPSSNLPATAAPAVFEATPTRMAATTGSSAGALNARLAPEGRAQEAYVVRIVDGDTIVVSLKGREVKVRYTGIDAPEMANPEHRQEQEPFAAAATERNRELVEGRTVTLEKDVSETDQYGRLLRYVYADGLMVNAQLILDGYAHYVTIPPDVKYNALFRRMQRQAKNENKGLWGK